MHGGMRAPAPVNFVKQIDEKREACRCVGLAGHSDILLKILTADAYARRRSNISDASRMCTILRLIFQCRGSSSPGRSPSESDVHQSLMDVGMSPSGRSGPLGVILGRSAYPVTTEVQLSSTACHDASHPCALPIKRWTHLYRAIDSNGGTVESWFRERRNLAAVKRFLRRALKRHDRPEQIVIDGSHTNREATLSCDTADQLENGSRRELKPSRIRQSADLNNRIEQDHRAIKRPIRPMLGSQSAATARLIPLGVEMIHMMCKGQAKYACNPQPSPAEQFDRLAA